MVTFCIAKCYNRPKDACFAKQRLCLWPSSVRRCDRRSIVAKMHFCNHDAYSVIVRSTITIHFINQNVRQLCKTHLENLLIWYLLVITEKSWCKNTIIHRIMTYGNCVAKIHFCTATIDPKSIPFFCFALQKTQHFGIRPLWLKGFFSFLK